MALQIVHNGLFSVGRKGSLAVTSSIEHIIYYILHLHLKWCVKIIIIIIIIIPHARCSVDPRSLLTTFTDILCQILCQVVRMSREHIVGSVHRRGQQNAVFATLVGLTKRFEAY